MHIISSYTVSNLGRFLRRSVYRLLVSHSRFRAKCMDAMDKRTQGKTSK